MQYKTRGFQKKKNKNKKKTKRTGSNVPFNVGTAFSGQMMQFNSVNKDSVAP